jgi:hypothetical protein
VAGPVTVETTARAAGWQRRRRDRPRSAAVTAYRPARTEWTLRNLGDPALVGTGSTSIDTATDNAEQPSQRHPDGREPSHEPRCHQGQRREPLGHFSGTANHNVPIALSPWRGGFGPSLSWTTAPTTGTGVLVRLAAGAAAHHTKDRERAFRATTTATSRPVGLGRPGARLTKVDPASGTSAGWCRGSRS